MKFTPTPNHRHKIPNRIYTQVRASFCIAPPLMSLVGGCGAGYPLDEFDWLDRLKTGCKRHMTAAGRRKIQTMCTVVLQREMMKNKKALFFPFFPLS